LCQPTVVRRHAQRQRQQRCQHGSYTSATVFANRENRSKHQKNGISQRDDIHVWPAVLQASDDELQSSTSLYHLYLLSGYYAWLIALCVIICEHEFCDLRRDAYL